MWYVIGAIVVVVAGFLFWRITSVARGTRQRDEKLIDALSPLGERLAAGSEVTADEVRTLCARYELRQMLYHMLKHLGKPELFPEECTSWESQAEGLLAQWMMHPNEYEAAPAVMECLQRVERVIDGRKATFIVLKFKMPAGHWAEKNGWLLGLSGPFMESDEPYSGPAGAFSRCDDVEGKVQPEALVDWYIDTWRSKCGQSKA